eukprot:4228641-Pyramimonas_sp.AAC.1
MQLGEADTILQKAAAVYEEALMARDMVKDKLEHAVEAHETGREQHQELLRQRREKKRTVSAPTKPGFSLHRISSKQFAVDLDFG